MTKKERKAFQEFMNQYTELEREANKAFSDLQELNRNEGTGHVWCCAETNYTDLLSCGKDYGYKFKKYVEAEAKKDLLTRYGQMLADLGFWDKKGE